jgi:hypothetical protein
MKTVFFFYFLGFFIGTFFGFTQGAESEQFDRAHANLKLQQCLEVIRK